MFKINQVLSGRAKCYIAIVFGCDKRIRMKCSWTESTQQINVILVIGTVLLTPGETAMMITERFGPFWKGWFSTCPLEAGKRKKKVSSERMVCTATLCCRGDSLWSRPASRSSVHTHTGPFLCAGFTCSARIHVYSSGDSCLPHMQDRGHAC